MFIDDPKQNSKVEIKQTKGEKKKTELKAQILTLGPLTKSYKVSL